MSKSVHLEVRNFVTSKFEWAKSYQSGSTERHAAPTVQLTNPPTDQTTRALYGLSGNGLYGRKRPGWKRALIVRSVSSFLVGRRMFTLAAWCAKGEGVP